MNETEEALHAALVELEEAVRPQPQGAPRPDLRARFEHIDALATRLPPGTDRELMHFLHRKSYQKARERLQRMRET